MTNIEPKSGAIDRHFPFVWDGLKHLASDTHADGSIFLVCTLCGHSLGPFKQYQEITNEVASFKRPHGQMLYCGR